MNDRFDPHFYLPRFKKLLAALRRVPYEVLGNIAKLSYQKWDTEEHQETTFRYIEINSVSRETGETSFSEILTKDAPSRAQMIVQKDDIIISLTRPHHGSIAQINESLDGCIASTGFAILREIKDPTLNRTYLYSVLRSQLCLQQMLQRSSGGNYPAITADQLMRILIPIPQSSIQNHIASFMRSAYAQKKQKEQEADTLLDSVDDYVLAELGIEMSEVVDKKCFVVNTNETVGRRFDSFYYQSKFRNVDQIMENAQFDVFNLGALISEISSGATPKVDENYYADSSTGVPFLRVQNVTSHGIDLSDAKFITRETHDGMLKRSRLKKDDLVFTITGRIGSVAVVPDNFEGNINQHSVRFRLKDQITNITINSHYIAAFLNSELGKSLSIREVTGGTRPALDYKAIKSLKIILPLIEIQNKIVAEIKNRLAKVAEFRSEAHSIVEEAKERVERILLAEK